MRAFVIGLGFVVAFVAGVLVARRDAPSDARRADGASEPSSIDEIVAWKRSVLDELRASLRDERASSKEAPSNSTSTLDTIERRIAALEERAMVDRAGAPSFRARPEWTKARGAGYATVEGAIEAMRAVAMLDGDTKERAWSAVRARFYLWTPDELFDAYGPPAEVDHRHGLGLSYGSFVSLRTSESCRLVFSFEDGLFASIDVVCW